MRNVENRYRACLSFSSWIFFQKAPNSKEGNHKMKNALPASTFSEGQGEEASKTAFYDHVRLRSEEPLRRLRSRSTKVVTYGKRNLSPYLATSVVTIDRRPGACTVPSRRPTGSWVRT